MLEKIKSSIASVGFGLVATVGAVSLIWWNEGKAVKNAQDTEAAGGAFIEVSSDSVNNSNEGKLVVASGSATTDDVLTDPVFRISENAIKLERSVEMYQWREIEERNNNNSNNNSSNSNNRPTYRYESTWSSTPIDSSRFHESGHSNPPMRHRGNDLVATNVKMGAFRLSAPLIGQINQGNDRAVTEAELDNFRGELPGQVTLDNGKVYAGSGSPSSNQVGDYRIGFRVVTQPQDVTVLAQQRGNSFTAWVGANGKEFNRLEPGILSGEQMIQAEEEADATLKWGLRIGGIILMAIGIGMIFNPLKELADVIPLVGGLISAGIGFFAFLIALFISFVVMAIAWIAARPVMGIILLVVAAAAIVGLVMMAKKKNAGAPAAGAAPKG